MYAILRDGSKQYKAEKGAKLWLDLKLDREKGDTVEFTDILLVSDGDKIDIGKPNVPNAKVVGKILKHDKGPKVVAYKYKKRRGYHRKVGHVQKYTCVEITEVLCT